MAGVFTSVLKSMRAKIRAANYIVSNHADEKMDDEALAIHDVECVVLTGAIEERQRDHETAEWKYRVRGESTDGSPVEAVAKLSPTGKLVIVTIYRL